MKKKSIQLLIAAIWLFLILASAYKEERKENSVGFFSKIKILSSTTETQ